MVHVRSVDAIPGKNRRVMEKKKNNSRKKKEKKSLKVRFSSFFGVRQEWLRIRHKKKLPLSSEIAENTLEGK